MKTKLILLDKPIIVSDEEIKEGDMYLVNNVRLTNEIRKATELKSGISQHKIIAGLDNLPEIDFNGLEEFGWVDVDKLAKRQWKNVHRTGVLGFIEGFKKAQSLNEKKFSLEDILQAIQLGREKEKFNFETNRSEHKYSYAEIIKLLQQPKVFDVEIEMEPVYLSILKEKVLGNKPKITNNKIKILKKL